MHEKYKQIHVQFVMAAAAVHFDIRQKKTTKIHKKIKNKLNNYNLSQLIRDTAAFALEVSPP